MDRKKLYYLLLLFLSLNSCKSQNNDITSGVLKNEIVVIFQNAPMHVLNEIHVTPKITVKSDEESMIIMFDGYKKNGYSPKTGIVDTLKIKPECEYLILKHCFNTISSITYLLKRGDTILFNYENNIPKAILKNNPQGLIDVEYPQIWRNKLDTSLKYTHYEIYKTPLFTKEKINNSTGFEILNRKAEIEKENFNSSKIDFANEQLFLDSLSHISKISKAAYYFYSKRIKYLSLVMDLNKGLFPDTLQLENRSKTESECAYSFYYNYLIEFLKTTVEKKATIIHQSDGKIADYREVFDKIADRKDLEAVYKNQILYNYLLAIGVSFSTADFIKYFKKAKNLISDTSLLTDVRIRILSEYNGNLKGSLKLLNPDRELFNYADLITKNKGKIIFVDFWASWCAPCRSAMPYSLKLQENYKGKDVVFVYVSIDKDFKMWEQGNNTERLSGYSLSFIAVDHENSSLAKQIKLITIPRYLIYDKKGNLINPNAPNPSSAQLVPILDKLLRQ